MMTESVKTRKSRVSLKMFEIEFKFSKFSLIRLKALCFDISETTKGFTAQSIAYVLRNLQGKQTFLKKMRKIYV